MKVLIANVKNAKKLAHQRKKHLETFGIALNHSQCLEMIAWENECKNWDSFVAKIKKAEEKKETYDRLKILSHPFFGSDIDMSISTHKFEQLADTFVLNVIDILKNHAMPMFDYVYEYLKTNKHYENLPFYTSVETFLLKGLYPKAKTLVISSEDDRTTYAISKRKNIINVDSFPMYHYAHCANKKYIWDADDEKVVFECYLDNIDDPTNESLILGPSIAKDVHNDSSGHLHFHYFYDLESVYNDIQKIGEEKPIT